MTDRTGRGDIDLVLGGADWSPIRSVMVRVMTSQNSYLFGTGYHCNGLGEHGHSLGAP